MVASSYHILLLRQYIWYFSCHLCQNMDYMFSVCLLFHFYRIRPSILFPHQINSTRSTNNFQFPQIISFHRRNLTLMANAILSAAGILAYLFLWTGGQDIFHCGKNRAQYIQQALSGDSLHGLGAKLVCDMYGLLVLFLSKINRKYSSLSEREEKKNTFSIFSEWKGQRGNLGVTWKP